MEADFAFAFNNASFSDRLLRIEITGGGGEVSCSGIVDGKRRRLDLNSDTHHHGYESYSEPKVTELHISSPILAAKSPFFFKLFSNGMRESQQRHVTLNIHASEEAAVMELLNFMYSNSLSVTTAPALLDVLMAADKFEVASCIEYCTRLLLSMPMTVDHALLLLDLPSSVVATASVEPLTIAARQFLASYYQDFHKFSEKEVIALPLVGIEAVLASDKLEIMSEDYLYDFVLKWAKIHYSDLQECQEILGSRLACYIRFPHMTCSKLKKIMSSNDFRPHVASSLVLEALFSKAESMHRQHVLPTERAYLNRPVQVVRFEVPRHQCIVYLDLKHKECSRLNPHGLIFSQVFLFGGHGFVLYAHRKFHCFRLYLKVLGKEPVSLTVEYEFAARSKPKNEFVSICNGNFDFTGGKSVGHRNLFLIPSESFIATDCPYFINEILHLRADLSIRL